MLKKNNSVTIVLYKEFNEQWYIMDMRCSNFILMKKFQVTEPLNVWMEGQMAQNDQLIVHVYWSNCDLNQDPHTLGQFKLNLESLSIICLW